MTTLEVELLAMVERLACDVADRSGKVDAPARDLIARLREVRPPIPFTPAAVADYLDGAIRKWRTRRAGGFGAEQVQAIHYIDALQSVRSSIFGEALP